MHTVITRIAAARRARRDRLAEQTQLLWAERRRLAQRSVQGQLLRFSVG